MAANFSIFAKIQAIDKFTAPMRKITGGLRGGLGQSLGQVGRNASVVSGHLRGLLGPVALLGGVASVGGMVSLVKSFSSGADEIGKFSRQIGFSTESYQEFRFAADRAGVNQALFNSSMVAFTKRLGEARAGTGGLFTILNKLSPAFLEQLKATKSNEEALSLLLKGMSKIKDPATRAALAAGAFSRSGVAMTRVAEQGAEGIAALRAEAQRLGVVIGTESTKEAEAFQDAMTNLTGSFSGLQNVIGGQLLPVIQPLIEQLTNFVVTNREIIGTKITAFVKSFAESVAKIDFGAVLDGVLSLVNLLGRAINFVGGIENAFIGLVAIMNGPLIVSIVSLLSSIGKLVFFLKGPMLTLLPLVGAGLKALALLVVANPIGATIAAIAGATALLIANWETVGPFFSGVWADIMSVFQSGADFVNGILDGITGGIGRLTSGLQAVGNFLGISGGGAAVGRGGSSLSGGQSAGSPLSALAAQSQNQVNGEIKVKFENAPPGTRIEQANTNKSALDLVTDLGTNLLNFATGG